MTKSFDQKIKELEQLKSESNIDFLQTKKQEYESELISILKDPISEWDESNAIKKFNEARECLKRITDINEKINRINQDWNSNQELENIDKKIIFYREKKKSIKELPLYRDTQEWINEIFWNDEVYKYAKDTNNKVLIEKLEKRKLPEEEYISILENEYPKYVANKRNEYVQKMENFYSELFLPKTKKKNKKPEIQQPPKTITLLPRWMSEQINEELKDNKNIKPQDIEKFLKNELKKNAWEIMISHIKNKFKENYNQAYEYIRRLIINYSWFKIIDNNNNKNTVTQTKSKNDKLLSSISEEDTEEHKNERLRKSKLINKLNEIWKIENLKTRISKYFDLFEELNNSFADRNEFESYVTEIITHTHIDIEKEIVKTLNWLIQWNIHMEKTLVYKYNVYKFNRGNRRMIAYPNWEIFALCPHEVYEKTINTQPPADKIE